MVVERGRISPDAAAGTPGLWRPIRTSGSKCNFTPRNKQSLIGVVSMKASRPFSMLQCRFQSQGVGDCFQFRRLVSAPAEAKTGGGMRDIVILHRARNELFHFRIQRRRMPTGISPPSPGFWLLFSSNCLVVTV